MRETHAPLESVWERLVSAVKEGSKRPIKSLKGFRLRRTSNLTFLKSGLKLHTVIAFVLENHRIRDKYVQKMFLHIQNKWFHVPMVKGKRKSLTFTECWSKCAEFCRFHRHIEKESTTMQRNRSAHTAWFLLVAWKILDFSHFKEKNSSAELLELAEWFSTF